MIIPLHTYVTPLHFLQKSNNPLIENKLELNNNYINPTKAKANSVNKSRNSSVPTKTVFCLTSRVPWVFATSASKVNYF